MDTTRKTHRVNVGWVALILAFIVMAMSSCIRESRGFVLPDGDAVAGEQVFIDLNCSECHSIADIQWSGSELNKDPYVKLGGEVSTIKTYGELVTSVINPSHKIERRSLNDQKTILAEGISKMETYRYNEIMTVQELVDLITFLQDQYKVVRPDVEYPAHGM